MHRFERYGLSEVDIENIIGELIKDEKIISAIEKIVNRRLRKNPNGSQTWRQCIVDTTVQEILQKLHIVDMILEERQSAGYIECRPSFSDSEPQQRGSMQHPRRRARELNNDTIHQKFPDLSQTDYYAVGDFEDLDKTQVLTVTLPAAVKELSDRDNLENLNSGSYGSARSGDELSSFHEPFSQDLITEHSEANVLDGEEGADISLQSAEDNMLNDSVKYEHNSDRSVTDSTDKSLESHENFPSGRSSRSNSFEAVQKSQGEDYHLEMEGVEGGSSSVIEDDDDKAASTRDTPEVEANLSMATYSDDEFEEPQEETENARRVHFLDPLVSDIYFTREKYDRDQVAEMFYSADEGFKFQMDFDRELERCMEVDMGWLEWMMERTEEEAQQHEKEDAEIQYEIEDDEAFDEVEGENFF